MKTALYVRCSTKHHNQDIENQILQLTAFCQKQGYEITKVYSDYESGDADRKGFNEMFANASKRKFDLLLFWSLDRFSREGVRKTLIHLQTLENYGITYKSFTEQFIDSAGIFKDVIVSILAVLSRQEKIKLQSRVVAGLEKARKQGRVGGRPKLADEVISKIQQLKQFGYSNRKISRELHISNTTVGQYV
ncbi:MAG: recombinase family protein [Bacteroidia bacterium]